MDLPVKTSALTIGSPAFQNNGSIPARYTCQGENINPAITIKNIPEGTESLALIAEDHDAPGETFVHWIVWNIKPVEIIVDHSYPGVEGRNSFGIPHYRGPCPPTGEHRYFFKIYALDSMLELEAGSDKEMLLKAMKDHILAQGELMGKYKKIRL